MVYKLKMPAKIVFAGLTTKDEKIMLG